MNFLLKKISRVFLIQLFPLSLACILLGAGCSTSVPSNEVVRYKKVFKPMIRHLQANICRGMPESEFLNRIPSEFYLNSGDSVQMKKIGDQRYKVYYQDVWVKVVFENHKLTHLAGFSWPQPYRNAWYRLPVDKVDRTDQPLICVLENGTYSPLSFIEGQHTLRFINQPIARTQQELTLSLVTREQHYDEIYINLPVGFFTGQQRVGTIKAGAPFRFHEYTSSNFLLVTLDRHEDRLILEKLLETYVVTTAAHKKSVWRESKLVGLTLIPGVKLYRPPQSKLSDLFDIPSEALFSIEEDL